MVECVEILKYGTGIAFKNSLVYAEQPFIVDADQINHCIFQKPTLKSLLMGVVGFKQFLG